METLEDEIITREEALKEMSDSFCPPGEEEYCKKYNKLMVEAIFGDSSKMMRDEYDALHEQKTCLDLIEVE